MLLKYFYDPNLAHASYLVGCQQTGEAIVIDPARNIDPYLAEAEKHGMQLVAAAETHIHADFVSGSRVIQQRTGAHLVLSETGPVEWQYGFGDTMAGDRILSDGESFRIGGIEFEVLATPGHTPESISFILTDRGGGAIGPMGIFTGDFVFVGAIGRPDLLEEAVGIQGSAEAGAQDLFQSLKRFKQLPDYLQVWPAHGAGSACGKGLGAIPSSTVGYEKRFNPGLQFEKESQFVDYILADQPTAPPYFARMKKVNQTGGISIAADQPVENLLASEAFERASQFQLIDTRRAEDYSNGHLKPSWNIPESLLAPWAANLVAPETELVLILDPSRLHSQINILRSVGLDRVVGFVDARTLPFSGFGASKCNQIAVEAFPGKATSENVQLIDVREKPERESARIPDSISMPLSEFPDRVSELPTTGKIVFHCRSGARSSIAMSIAEAAGLESLHNLTGGIEAWQKAGLPLERANLVHP